MPHSIVTPIVVFLLALAASYLITRPVGGVRRHVAATLISLALGGVGGFATAAIALCVTAALSGAFLAMMISWRRRNPLEGPHSAERHESSKRSHYHAAKRPA